MSKEYHKITMSIQFGDISIGLPICFGSLSVFPLFRQGHPPIDYLLAEEAMAVGAVTVSEISEQGSVPELFVENKAAQRILFLEGEELKGAKQNRILNTSVLVAANSKIKIPVSCVEAGRWKRSSAVFAASQTISSSFLRYSLKSSVTHSLKDQQGHRSDQSRVWRDVRQQQDALAVSSPTAAMSDTYEKYDQHLTEARRAVQYVDGASGMAVAIGPKVVSADLFDKPETCAKVWSKLLSGVALDALLNKDQSGLPDLARVEQFLHETRNAEWTQAAAVGEGQEYRAVFDGKMGSALLLDGAVVHGSVSAGAE